MIAYTGSKSRGLNAGLERKWQNRLAADADSKQKDKQHG
jgi:hypothetical protein